MSIDTKAARSLLTELPVTTWRQLAMSPHDASEWLHANAAKLQALLDICDEVDRLRAMLEERDICPDCGRGYANNCAVCDEARNGK